MMDNHALHRLVGRSIWTERVLRQILQAARYHYPLLIQGEAGTGKRLIARAIHAHHRQADRPFVPFRCGLLPDRFECHQLFGHAASQSSLARGAALGACGAAAGGTLFLENVERLGSRAQTKLSEFLASNRDVTDDRQVRVAASSTAELKPLAQRGEFAFRLLCTLSAIRIQTEPLAQRPEDVLPLARHFITRTTLEQGWPFRPLTAVAAALLESYRWPGNVGELEKELETTLLSSPDSETLDLFDFPRLLNAFESESETPMGGNDPQQVNEFESVPQFAVVGTSWPSLQQVTTDHIASTLRQTGYRLAVAARLLKIDVHELQAMIKRLRIPVPIAGEETARSLETDSQ